LATPEVVGQLTSAAQRRPFGGPQLKTMQRAAREWTVQQPTARDSVLWRRMARHGRWRWALLFRRGSMKNHPNLRRSHPDFAVQTLRLGHMAAKSCSR